MEFDKPAMLVVWQVSQHEICCELTEVLLFGEIVKRINRLCPRFNTDWYNYAFISYRIGHKGWVDKYGMYEPFSCRRSRYITRTYYTYYRIGDARVYNLAKTHIKYVYRMAALRGVALTNMDLFMAAMAELESPFINDETSSIALIDSEH